MMYFNLDFFLKSSPSSDHQILSINLISNKSSQFSTIFLLFSLFFNKFLPYTWIFSPFPFDILLRPYLRLFVLYFLLLPIILMRFRWLNFVCNFFLKFIFSSADFKYLILNLLLKSIRPFFLIDFFPIPVYP